MRRVQAFRLILSYDGTEFSGWQFQPQRRTVQGVLEEAVAAVTGCHVRVVGSGRTDAGVHALGQLVSLSCDTHLEPTTLGRALNANLPRDVAVLESDAAPLSFNAIDHSISKRYRYVIQEGPLQDIFSRHYAWHVRGELQVDEMQRAAQLLVGKHDFKSYESAGSRRVSTVRHIRRFDVERTQFQNGERVVIEVEADGFLYNMVRNLVGTLVEVGRRKQPGEWPHAILAKRDRRFAGMTAPPQGLYLAHVEYELPVVDTTPSSSTSDT